MIESSEFKTEEKETPCSTYIRNELRSNEHLAVTSEFKCDCYLFLGEKFGVILYVKVEDDNKIFFSILTVNSSISDDTWSLLDDVSSAFWISELHYIITHVYNWLRQNAIYDISNGIWKLS